MRSTFTATLVNGVWGDPGLCLDLKFQRRAILFDIGESLPDAFATEGVLLQDRQFRVRAAAFEHHDILSLGFRFEEDVHINVWKNRLEALSLPTGVRAAFMLCHRCERGGA